MKTYHRTRFFTWLILLLIALLLGGCSQRAEVTDDAAEKMQITVAYWDVKSALSGDSVLREIEDRFGVEFVPENMTWNDYYQKVERWAATGSLPDLFVGDFRNSSNYTLWIEQGLLRRIPDDLSAYPNLAEYLHSMQDSLITVADNGLYCIPRRSYPAQAWTSIDRIVAYRWDLAQAAGITKEPENWEEFREMILAIIEADPEQKDIKGMTAVSPDFLSSVILPYASSIAVSDGNSFYWEKAEDGRYLPAYFHADLLPAFEMARDMYETGVIEQDVAMQTRDGALEKFLQGENAAIVYSGGFGNVYERIDAPWKKLHGHDYTQDVKALHLMPDINGQKAYPVWGYAWSESFINGGVSDEKLAKILEIYDWLLSEEGAIFATFGPEGDYYDIVDGAVSLHDMSASVTEKYPSCALFSQLVQWSSSAYDQNFAPAMPEAYMQVNNSLAQEAAQVRIPDYEPRCTVVMREAGIDFTIQVGDDFLRIMTGAEPVEQMWGEIRQAYEANGLNELIETVNQNMHN